jgi:hypothetical protein
VAKALRLKLTCFPAPYPCSVGTVFFSALTFSAAVIAAHGAFREPDNLFVDEVEVRDRRGGRGRMGE